LRTLKSVSLLLQLELMTHEVSLQQVVQFLMNLMLVSGIYSLQMALLGPRKPLSSETAAGTVPPTDMHALMEGMHLLNLSQEQGGKECPGMEGNSTSNSVIISSSELLQPLGKNNS
jgi:hypothetical protein